ncbi:MAG: tyrosinase family protein [Bacteroidota bacterium]
MKILSQGANASPVLLPGVFILVLVTIIFFSGCPKISLPDGSTGMTRDMPVLEVQINNTATTVDDYIGTSAVACRVRLLNDNAFDTPIEIRMQNINVIDQKVAFNSASSGSFSNFLVMSVPSDGSWGSFYIEGVSGNFSSVDKDAVIEVKENRLNLRNVVLARKALMVTNSPLPAVTPQIEVQINGSAATIDDYVTWSPFFCRARIVNHTSFSSPLDVRLQNASFANGRVRFADDGTLDPTTNSVDPLVTDYHTAGNMTLNISLPDNGDWKTFWVAGEFGDESDRDKDAMVEVIEQSSSDVLGRWALMVRVRKDANQLSNEERDRFLNALRSLQPHGLVAFDRYQDFIDQHTVGTNESHSTGSFDGPGFLPWHRTYLLRIERDLQSLDPSVALPYWKFDAAAGNMFDPEFLGQRSSGDWVTLNAGNPLATWTIPGMGMAGIRRRPYFNDQTGTPGGIASEMDVFSLGTTYGNFRSMEGNPHGTAHVQAAGANGWVRNFFSSPRDPLFFLIHCNVDRLWAKWQIRQRRTLHPEFVEAYDAQGDFASAPAANNIHIGHYLEDTMWPWNETSGTGGSGKGDRPTTSYGAFPAVQGHVLSIPANPRPFDVIDYRNTRLGPTFNAYTNNGLGFAYDDVSFVSAL